MTKKTINIPIITRVEGEGALDLTIRNNVIEDLKLKIYEPPRLFENFLQGRSYNEVLDFVARICGICPVAYQMSAAYALESIFNFQASSWIRSMRRVFYCGEWIESHSLHIHLLAAPDFLGYPSVIEMAKDHPEIVKRGLRLQALGNDIIKCFGKRSVHPVGACVGGFYSAPDPSDIAALLPKLETGLQDARSLLAWVANLDLPIIHKEQDFPYVSLQHPTEYPINEGVVAVNTANSNSQNQISQIPIHEFLKHFAEKQVPYSNALHCYLQNQSYLVGPLARVNINFSLLPEVIKQYAKDLNLSFPSRNMFHSIIARAVEIYFAIFHAFSVLQNYTYPKQSKHDFTVQAGVGYGCTEAPRGLLWHRYETDENGTIVSARLIPPTSQNQARIEDDLRYSLSEFGLDSSEEQIKHRCEMLIRNYDPCISCATHFLKLKVDRK